jgi:hypothetical protein
MTVKKKEKSKRTAAGNACPGNWRARFHSSYLCNTHTFLANSLKNYCELFNHVQNPSSPGQIHASIAWKYSMKVKCSKAIRLLLERLRFSQHAVMTYEKRLFRIPIIRNAIHSDLNNAPIMVPVDKHLSDHTSRTRIKRKVSFSAHTLVGHAPRTLHCL